MRHPRTRSAAVCVVGLSTATLLTGCGASHHAASATVATPPVQAVSQPAQAEVRDPGRYLVTILMTTSDSLRTMRHLRRIARRGNGSLGFVEADSLPGQSYASFPNYRDANAFSAALFREHLEQVLSVRPA